MVTQRLRVVLGFGFGFFLDLGSCSCSGFGVGVLENGGETGKEILYTHPRNLGFDPGKKWDVWLVSWLVSWVESTGLLGYGLLRLVGRAEMCLFDGGG